MQTTMPRSNRGILFAGLALTIALGVAGAYFLGWIAFPELMS